MRTVKADWQMIYYVHAVYAFTDPTVGNENLQEQPTNEQAKCSPFLGAFSLFLAIS